MYRFSKELSTLTQVDAIDNGVSVGRVVEWSADGKYLIFAGDLGGGAGEDMYLYSFNRSTETLTEIQAISPGGQTGNEVFAVSWSPDGGYVAVGTSVVSFGLNIYQAYIFPSNNVINNNAIYCNSGNQYPGGVGISGSSIANLMIGNTAFDNSFNYQFVCNVFDQLFGDGPSLTQNITVQPDVPIITPDDIPTRIKRTNLLLESLIDNLL